MPRAAPRVSSRSLAGAYHLHRDVEAALQAGCFSFVHTKSHQKFNRIVFTPHDKCAACRASQAPCNEHTHQQTVIFSFSPSGAVDGVERSEIRKKERLMLDSRARCATCSGAVQHTDPDGRHYIKL